jgi:hypothetical protein
LEPVIPFIEPAVSAIHSMADPPPFSLIYYLAKGVALDIPMRFE